MARKGGRLIAAGPEAAAELLAALPIPLLAVSPEDCIGHVNAAAEAWLNLSRGVLRGRLLAEAIGGPLAARLANPPVAVFDEALRLPDGRVQRADLLAAAWPERAGWRIVTLHPHPTAMPRAGADEGVRAAAGAAAMLAHEIKNPLAGIRGAAQLLESGVAPEARALTRLIRDEVDRIAALIDGMEGFTDTRLPELGPLNIHAVLDHARAVATAGFTTPVTVAARYDPSLPPVLGNRDALVQVFINLLANAAEALGAGGGTVTLATAYRHGMHRRGERGAERRALAIEVCVIDDGRGAPAEIAEHLFEPFVSSKASGRGLGLALVRKLVADCGGMIEYAREGRPERTVFRLLLARAEERR